MATRTARVTYYLAICVFLIFLGILVVKMTFWPVCTGGAPCDGWTVAGLVAAVLGVSTAFLGILGAIALAAWWTGLDKRVENSVTQLFNAQIQTVQDSIDQLDKRADDLRGKVEAIEHTLPTQIQIVQDSINQLRRRTDDLLTASTQAVEDSIKRVEKQTGEVQDRLKALDHIIEELELQISTVQEGTAKALDATVKSSIKRLEGKSE